MEELTATDTQSTDPELPDGWDATPEGMRRADGIEVPGIVVGHDAKGSRLIIRRAGAVVANEELHSLNEIALGKQVTVALRRIGYRGADGRGLRALIEDLGTSAHHASDAAYAEFLAKIGGEKLLRLAGEGGIGPRRFVNIAEIMRHGREPRPMLLPEWLVEGELHWVYAPPEGLKTWLVLVLAAEVLNQGGTVAWMDEDLGEVQIAQRLLRLHADPDVVERQFHYMPRPAWGSEGDKDAMRWRSIVTTQQPDMTVIDTATDALTEAGLDENLGSDVTGWVKAFVEPALGINSCVVVLDHVPKNASNPDYAIGSRAKRAKAKVQYRIDVEGKPDRDEVCTMRVVLTKNTNAAEIPGKRTFNVRLKGDSLPVLEPVPEGQLPAGTVERNARKREDGMLSKRRRVRDALRDAKQPLPAKHAAAMAGIGAQGAADLLLEMSHSNLWPIRAYDGDPKEVTNPQTGKPFRRGTPLYAFDGSASDGADEAG